MEEKIKIILQQKEKEVNAQNISKCKQAYEKALKQNFHAVALDIDGTLCDNDNSIPTTTLLDSIYKLVKQKVILIFITGRGRGGAREFIYDLRKVLLDNYTDLNINDFNKRWYAITHSGLYLLYTQHEDYNSFLKEEKSLYNVELSKKDINIIYYKLHYKNDLFFLKSIERISKEPSSKYNNASIRIVFKENDDIKIKTIIYHIRKEVLKDNRIKQKYHLITGKYQNNIVLEITPLHKGDAIRNAAKYIGLTQDSILRIGDRGAEYENDHGMLASSYGFSVDSISKSMTCCFPIIDDAGNILQGIRATTFLIDKLAIFPTLTLPKPDKTKYYDELSIFEKKAYLNSRALQVHYSKIISSFFQDELTSDNWVKVSDIFDIKSGGVKFRDWEWNTIDPNHSLKKIFNQRESGEHTSPLFKYILKSDSSIIMRGVYSYYFGLAYRDAPNWILDWYNCFLDWLKLVNNAFSESSFNLYNNIDRKFIFAICDTIRHFLLTLLNSLLNLETIENVSLLIASEITGETKKIFKLTINNTEYLYKLLFDDLFLLDINEISNHTKNIEALLTHNKKRFVEDIINDNSSQPRVWREVDFFLENFSCIKAFLEKLQRKNKEKIWAHGILYGGIELPIIAEVLANKMGIEIDICFIKINFPYANKHNNRQTKINLDDYIHPLKEKFQTINKHQPQLVFDDNILTGVTGQMTLELLYKMNIIPHAFIFVRYPSLNRVPQMFFKGHGAPDISLFNLYVFGLTSASPYSRIFARNPDGNPYLDALGIFNKSRTRINNLIKKNKLFLNKELES